MGQPDGSDERKHNVPPYIAFQTLKTLIADSKEHGVPGRIDKTVLTRFSGGVGSQLISALRFLELIDSENTPTSQFRSLVGAYGTTEWSTVLRHLIAERYPPIISLDLKTATPGQFSSVFKANYPATDETQRKCMTFFLNAAREGGIDISPYILKGTKPRANGRTVKRKPGTPRAASSPLTATLTEAAHAADRLQPTLLAPVKSPEQVLLDMLNPATMAPDEQQAVWTLLLYLKKNSQ